MLNNTKSLTLCINRDAVNGRLTIQKSKSEMHKDSTNVVVACLRSFGFRSNAMIVIKFPGNGNKFFFPLCFLRYNAESLKENLKEIEHTLQVHT